MNTDTLYTAVWFDSIFEYKDLFLSEKLYLKSVNQYGLLTSQHDLLNACLNKTPIYTHKQFTREDLINHYNDYGSFEPIPQQVIYNVLVNTVPEDQAF